MIKVLYICDRCGKETEMDKQPYRKGDFVHTKVGYTRYKGIHEDLLSTTIDVCEDCLNEFIEWAEVNNNDDA